jgi:hypothetical protein
VPAQYTAIELRPAQGGKLLGAISEDTGAEANYTLKQNFRRDLDVEMRREGWELFNPKYDNNLLDMPLYEDDDVTLFFQFARPNGDTALIAVAGDKMYRLFASKDMPEYMLPDWVYPNSGTEDSYYEGGRFDFNWKLIKDGLAKPGSIRKIEILAGGEYFDETSTPVAEVMGNGEEGSVSVSMVPASVSPPQGQHAPDVIGTYAGKMRRAFTITAEKGAYSIFRGVGDDRVIIGTGVIDTNNSIPMEYGLSVRFSVGHYPTAEEWTTVALPVRIGTAILNSSGKNYDLPPEIRITDESGLGTGATGQAYIHPHNRWEAISLSGYAVINNGIDLPIAYREEWEDAKPVYGLRELGIVTVGCIAEFGGYMLCADLRELDEDSLVRWIEACAADPLIDPYGHITDELATEYNLAITETQYAIIWSKAGYPLRWGPVHEGSTNGGSDFWIPKYPHFVKSLTEGQDFTVVGAGPAGAPLVTTIKEVFTSPGGDVATIRMNHSASEGDVIDNATGNAAIDGDGIPDGTLTDAVSLSSLAGGDSVEVSGDGSKILSMRKLMDRLIIYRQTGYWIASLENSVDDPFSFTERYNGQRTADYRNTIVNVAEKYHMFLNQTGVYKIDLTEPEPTWIDAFQVGPEVWKGLESSHQEKVFAFDNALTGEVWLCLPEREDGQSTLCFDYRTNTVSTIDHVFTAGLVIRRPQNPFTETSDDMCILSYDGTVYTYGYGVAERPAVYNRASKGYSSVIQSSLMNFKDRFNEKDLRSYVLLLDQASPTLGTHIEIFSKGSILDEAILEAESFITDLDDETMIPLWSRSIFFRDRITVTGKDNPMRLASRIFEVSVAKSRSQTQSTGEGYGPK